MELPEHLIKLYDTQVPCVAVGRNINTDWRCPDDVANNIVLQLAPPLLYIHKDSFQYIDLGNCVSWLVLSFYKLAYYRYLSISATSLHPPCQCSSLHLQEINLSCSCVCQMSCAYESPSVLCQFMQILERDMLFGSALNAG